MTRGTLTTASANVRVYCAHSHRLGGVHSYRHRHHPHSPARQRSRHRPCRRRLSTHRKTRDVGECGHHRIALRMFESLCLGSDTGPHCVGLGFCSILRHRIALNGFGSLVFPHIHHPEARRGPHPPHHSRHRRRRSRRRRHNHLRASRTADEPVTPHMCASDSGHLTLRESSTGGVAKATGAITATGSRGNNAAASRESKGWSRPTLTAPHLARPRRTHHRNLPWGRECRRRSRRRSRRHPCRHWSSRPSPARHGPCSYARPIP